MIKANDGKILEIKRSDQYRTVDELVTKSQPTSVYFTFLVLSSFIVASGLLLDNVAVVIGGMLVTPVLTPVLMVALGISIGEFRTIKRVAILMLESFLIIILGSLFLGFLFQSPQQVVIADDTLRVAVLYFIIAVSAGVAATFAWGRREMADVLPGIAIAVSLVPPLSLIGVSLSYLNLVMMRYSFIVFLLNLLGILAGSVVAFSLMKFHKTQQEVKKEVRQVERRAN